MLAAYERLTREVQLLDTGEGKGLPKADAPAEPDNQLGADDRILANLVMTITV